MKTKTKTKTQGVLDEALKDMQTWASKMKLPKINVTQNVDDVATHLGLQFATLLRMPDVERVMEEMPAIMATIKRAKIVSEEEVSRLLECIKTVFNEALLEARAVIDDSTNARLAIKQFENDKRDEIQNSLKAARDEIASVVRDFASHVEKMQRTTAAARSIQTVLAEMRGHAAQLRGTILQNLADENYTAAKENIQAMFAFYDVDLCERFDTDKEVIYGKNLRIDVDGSITLNGKKLKTHKANK